MNMSIFRRSRIVVESQLWYRFNTLLRRYAKGHGHNNNTYYKTENKKTRVWTWLDNRKMNVVIRGDVWHPSSHQSWPQWIRRGRRGRCIGGACHVTGFRGDKDTSVVRLGNVDFVTGQRSAGQNAATTSSAFSSRRLLYNSIFTLTATTTVAKKFSLDVAEMMVQCATPISWRWIFSRANTNRRQNEAADHLQWRRVRFALGQWCVPRKTKQLNFWRRVPMRVRL